MLVIERSKRILGVLAFLFLSFGGSNSARAGLFSITNRNYGNVPAAQHAFVDAAFDALAASINSVLPSSSPGTFLPGMADAAVFSSLGVASDYATAFNIFDLSGNVGLGLKNATLGSFTKGGNAKNQLAGFGVQGAVMVGINGGILTKGSGAATSLLDLSRFKFYGHFYTQSLSFGSINAGFTSWGLDAQFKIIKGQSVGLNAIKWGGVDISSGLNSSSLNVLVQAPVAQSATSNVPGFGTMTTAFVGTASVGANVHVYSVPIEVTTSARLLYLFDFYTGLGMDLNFGSSNGIANLSGPVTVSTSSPTFGTIAGTGTLDLGNNTTPTVADFRWLAGSQIELGVIAFFFQTSQNFSGDTHNYALGLRAFY